MSEYVQVSRTFTKSATSPFHVILQFVSLHSHPPTGIPAKNLWSVTAYHPDTRSLLQNGIPKPSTSSYDSPEANADGSVDIWFAPKPPRRRKRVGWPVWSFSAVGTPHPTWTGGRYCLESHLEWP